MIQDKLLQFSEEQDLGSADGETVVSTNVIDTGVEKDIGPGVGVQVVATVTESFAGGTAVQFVLFTDTAAAMTTAPVAILSSPVTVIANLAAGDKVDLGRVPAGANRYFRVSYVVTGTMTAGMVTTQLIDVLQNGYKNA